MNLFAQIAGVAISIGFSAFFLRVMTLEQIAITALYQIFEGVMAPLRDMGLAATSIREVPGLMISKKFALAKNYLRITFWVPSFLSIVVGTIACVASAELSLVFLKTSAYVKYIYPAVIYAVISSMLTQILLNLQALQKFKVHSGLLLFTQFSQRVVSLFCWFRWGLIGYLYGFTGATLVGLIVGVSYLWKYISLKNGIRDISAILYKSLPYYLSNWSRFFFNQADQLVVGILLSPSLLAVYYVIRNIVRQVTSLWDSMFTPLAPKLSEIFRSDSLSTTKQSMSGKITVLIQIIFWSLAFLTVLMVVHSRTGLEFYTGGAYSSYWWFFALFSLTVIPYGISATFSPLILVFNHPSDRLKYELTTGISSILGLFILIPIFGLVGAAISQILSYTISLFVGFYLVSTNIKLNFRLKFFLPISIMTLIVVLYCAEFVSRLGVVSQISVDIVNLVIFIALGWLVIDNVTKSWIKIQLKNLTHR